MELPVEYVYPMRYMPSYMYQSMFSIMYTDCKYDYYNKENSIPYYVQSDYIQELATLKILVQNIVKDTFERRLD